MIVTYMLDGNRIVTETPQGEIAKHFLHSIKQRLLWESKDDDEEGDEFFILQGQRENWVVVELASWTVVFEGEHDSTMSWLLDKKICVGVDTVGIL